MPLENATDPSIVKVGSVLVAGSPRFWSVVRITAIDAVGQVPFQRLNDDDPAARQLLATVA